MRSILLIMFILQYLTAKHYEKDSFSNINSLQSRVWIK